MAKIHFLNVGHGDCTVIEHNNGNLTVIDINNGTSLDSRSFEAILDRLDPTASLFHSINQSLGLGADDMAELRAAGYDVELTNPIEFLQSNYPGRSIFRYIQTHPDFDHLRGLAALRNSGIRIENFWDTPHTRQWDEESDKEGDWEDWQAYEELRNGTSPKVLRLYRGAKGSYWNQGEDGQGGGNGLHILSPTKELVSLYDQDGLRNELSYVIEYRTANRRVILGGDAEEAAWESILEYFGEKKLKCDVLKASHHGRDSGYHSEAVRVMRPDYTIVSVGKKPETDASNKYRQFSKRVWSTRWWGDLTLHIDGDGNMKWTASNTTHAT